ncbi:MAG: pimeloyl-ACP methyl ester carboxylesterase [Crocinitomicaceae bacterium]|jgi:pimeloyl-ACP methyl ester carboxylesterase
MKNEITINIKGINIQCLKWGNPAGESILLLHGWLDNAASFSNLAPLLEQYNVVAVDLPGHGLSEHWPSHGHYHFWAGVEDIELILDQLGWQQCHIVGHSMGAAMATLYAGTFPDRMLSLTLIEAIGPLAGDADGTPERVAQSIEQMKSHNPLQSHKPSIDPFIKARLKGHLKLSEASSKLIMTRSVNETDEGFSWSNDKRLKHTSMIRLPEAFIVSFIQRITCPVLGVFATDGIFKEDHIQSRWDYIQNPYSLLWLDGGHHLHMDGDVRRIAQNIKTLIG